MTSIFFADILRILRLLDTKLRIRASLTLVLMLAQSLLELGFVVTLTSMGLALSNSAALRGNIAYKGFFLLFPSLGLWAENAHNLLILAGCSVVIICIIKNVVNYFCARGIALLGEDISLALGAEIMERFLYRDYAWHLSPISASMFQRMIWRANLGVMLTHLLSMYACVFTTLILFLSLVSQEPVLTTLVLAITGTVGVVLYRMMRRKVDHNAGVIACSAQAETKALLCASKGIREVLIYQQQPAFLNALVQAALQGRKPRTFINIAPTFPTWVLEATGFIVVVLAITFLVYVQEATPQRLTVALALLLLTAWRVLPFCNRIVSLQISVRSLRPVSEAVLELLEELRKTKAPMQVVPVNDFTFSHSIFMNDVSFQYADATANSLQNITFTIQKGQRIGLIGSSGAGKSTLAAVLSGLLPVGSGEIMVDGVALTPERSATFAKCIGYVPQSPFLFAGTLAENIAFSSWGKPWDKDRMREACAQAAIDFIDTHPAGLDQPIGENGAGLSGGQAQRVSIARAMYTRPDLLIFDEATSALDQGNENAIQQTIETLSGAITCVIIAHRLTTVAKCDVIVWLEKGRIVMQGPALVVLDAYTKSQHEESCSEQ